MQWHGSLLEMKDRDILFNEAKLSWTVFRDLSSSANSLSLHGSEWNICVVRHLEYQQIFTQNPLNRRVSKFFPINSHKLRTIRAENVHTARVLWIRLITSQTCNNRDGCSTARPCILKNVSSRCYALLTNQIARILVGVVQYQMIYDISHNHQRSPSSPILFLSQYN